MLAYWLMFTMWSLLAVQAERRRAQDPRAIAFVFATIVTTLMVGLRFEVGGDWFNYTRMYDAMYFLSWPDALSFTDPAYAALNWTSAQANLGTSPVNLICGILFMTGFTRLASRQPNPALAVLVAVPYLIIVVAMGYTRQAAAIGIICFALADLSERQLPRLVLLIGLAALFHKSAVIMLPIALVPIFRRNVISGVFGSLLFIGMFFLLLRDSSERMVANYVNSDYDSQGAAVRIAMNVLAASLFLLLRKRIEMPTFQKSFWTTCSLLALLSVVGLAASSASAGVDRISLYLIPLQAVTLSRLPCLLGSRDRALPSILFVVIGYSFAVQFVWLNYATNAASWLPFQMSF